MDSMDASGGDAGARVSRTPARLSSSGSATSSEGGDMWLAAYDDPLAGLNVKPGCLQLEELQNDQEYSLVLADMGDLRQHMKLKIYKVQ